MANSAQRLSGCFPTGPSHSGPPAAHSTKESSMDKEQCPLSPTAVEAVTHREVSVAVKE